MAARRFERTCALGAPHGPIGARRLWISFGRNQPVHFPDRRCPDKACEITLPRDATCRANMARKGQLPACPRPHSDEYPRENSSLYRVRKDVFVSPAGEVEPGAVGQKAE